MKSTPATYFSDVERCVDAILDKVVAGTEAMRAKIAAL